MMIVALSIVVTLHVLLGEMVPKNIAIAGPERTAMLLIPVYLLYVRAARPLIALGVFAQVVQVLRTRTSPLSYRE